MMQRILHPCVSFAQLDPEFVSMAKQFKLFKKKTSSCRLKKKTKKKHIMAPFLLENGGFTLS